MVLIAEPARLRLPAICIRQLESLAMTYSTPLRESRASFSSRIALEISPYFTENVPPKPQQVSGASISTNSTSRTARIRRRGSSAIIQFAQQMTGVVIGNAASEASPHVFDFQLFHDELGKLTQTQSHALQRAAAPFTALTVKEFSIEVSHHRCARTRRRPQ